MNPSSNMRVNADAIHAIAWVDSIWIFCSMLLTHPPSALNFLQLSTPLFQTYLAPLLFIILLPKFGALCYETSRKTQVEKLSKDEVNAFCWKIRGGVIGFTLTYALMSLILTLFPPAVLAFPAATILLPAIINGLGAGLGCHASCLLFNRKEAYQKPIIIPCFVAASFWTLSFQGFCKIASILAASSIPHVWAFILSQALMLAISKFIYWGACKIFKLYNNARNDIDHKNSIIKDHNMRISLKQASVLLKARKAEYLEAKGIEAKPWAVQNKALKAAQKASNIETMLPFKR